MEIADAVAHLQPVVGDFDAHAVEDAALVQVVGAVSQQVLAADVFANLNDQFLQAVFGAGTVVGSPRPFRQQLQGIVENQILHPPHKINHNRNHIARDVVAALLDGGGGSDLARRAWPHVDPWRERTAFGLLSPQDSRRQRREPHRVDHDVFELSPAQRVPHAGLAAVVL